MFCASVSYCLPSRQMTSRPAIFVVVGGREVPLSWQRRANRCARSALLASLFKVIIMVLSSLFFQTIIGTMANKDDEYDDKQKSRGFILCFSSMLVVFFSSTK